MRKRDSPATYAIFPCALQHQPDSVTQQDGENPTRLVQGFSALVRPDAALAFAAVVIENVAVAGVVPAKLTEEGAIVHVTPVGQEAARRESTRPEN
jgi:hypothetical protein